MREGSPRWAEARDSSPGDALRHHRAETHHLLIGLLNASSTRRQGKKVELRRNRGVESRVPPVLDKHEMMSVLVVTLVSKIGAEFGGCGRRKDPTRVVSPRRRCGDDLCSFRTRLGCGDSFFLRLGGRSRRTAFRRRRTRYPRVGNVLLQLRIGAHRQITERDTSRRARCSRPKILGVIPRHCQMGCWDRYLCEAVLLWMHGLKNSEVPGMPRKARCTVEACARPTNAR